MRPPPLLYLTGLVVCSCRGGSPELADASAPRPVADASVDASDAAPASSWPYTHIPPPPPDYGLDAVDKAIEASGAALREQIVSRFHEDSARANGVSVSRHRATVAITGFEHIRSVRNVIVTISWAFYASWVRVVGDSSTTVDASMLVTRKGRTILDASPAHFDANWLPVLSAQLRVRSFEDPKRRMRSYYGRDRMSPVCDRDFHMGGENGTILDLRSGCSYIRYMETPPPPPDFATSPCGPDGLPESHDK